MAGIPQHAPFQLVLECFLCVPSVLQCSKNKAVCAADGVRRQCDAFRRFFTRRPNLVTCFLVLTHSDAKSSVPAVDTEQTRTYASRHNLTVGQVVLIDTARPHVQVCRCFDKKNLQTDQQEMTIVCLNEIKDLSKDIRYLSLDIHQVI